MGASLREQALVNHAAARHGPSGFDPSRVSARLRALAEEWFECCGDIHEPLIEAAETIEAMARERDETGWLIEERFGDITHWIALTEDKWPMTKPRAGGRIDQYRSPVRRSKDANDAIRFARQGDAEAFIRLFDRFLLHPVATEHMWPAQGTSAGTAETPQAAQGEARRPGPKDAHNPDPHHSHPGRIG
jgi:hypothetical protein